MYDAWQAQQRAQKEEERKAKTDAAAALQGYRRSNLSEEETKLAALREEERLQKLNAEQQLHGYRGKLSEGESKLAAQKQEEHRKKQDLESKLRHNGVVSANDDRNIPDNLSGAVSALAAGYSSPSPVKRTPQEYEQQRMTPSSLPPLSSSNENLPQPDNSSTITTSFVASTSNNVHTTTTSTVVGDDNNNHTATEESNINSVPSPSSITAPDDTATAFADASAAPALMSSNIGAVPGPVSIITPDDTTAPADDFAAAAPITSTATTTSNNNNNNEADSSSPIVPLQEEEEEQQQPPSSIIHHSTVMFMFGILTDDDIDTSSSSPAADADRCNLVEGYLSRANQIARSIIMDDITLGYPVAKSIEKDYCKYTIKLYFRKISFPSSIFSCVFWMLYFMLFLNYKQLTDYLPYVSLHYNNN
jgi:hypothetical protein